MEDLPQKPTISSQESWVSVGVWGGQAKLGAVRCWTGTKLARMSWVVKSILGVDRTKFSRCQPYEREVKTTLACQTEWMSRHQLRFSS